MSESSPLRHGDFVLRPARDDDSAALIEVIDRVYQEYPGCILDVDNEEPELRSPASSFDEMWVAEHDGRVVGSSALKLFDEGLGELKKVFLASEARGNGVGGRLIQIVEERAREHGCERLFLWTDTRFELAHSVYKSLGYEQTGAERELHDRSRSREYRFEKRIARS